MVRCPSQARIMRASDLALIGETQATSRSRRAKPDQVGPRQRMKDERLAHCLAMTAAIDETEDNALRCSISAQTGIVPSKQEANWAVTSPAASPVVSPERPSTSSTASLKYLAGSPERHIYDPTVPMEWSEEGPVMQHAQIGKRFSFHQVASKRAELTQENEGKRLAQNRLLADVLAEAKQADEKIAEAELARKRAAKERKEAYAAKMAAAVSGIDLATDPEPAGEQTAAASGPEQDARLWRAVTEPAPRCWWPSAWVYGTDESVERVDEGAAATKKQHQRYYGKVHAGYRDVIPGLPPKTYNLISSYIYPNRERMGRLDALRELPSGLRLENDTAIQTIRVRTPSSKYANEYSQVNSPAMTKRFIFRSEQRAATIHGLDMMPELPKEIAPASNPMAVEAAKAETEKRLSKEVQHLEQSGDCLLGHRPPSVGMVADGSHQTQADRAALQGVFQVPRDYASLPHRGCGPLDAAGCPRVDTTGYFPASVKPVKIDGETAQHAPTPAGGYYVSQTGAPMVGRVSSEMGIPHRDRPIGRQEDKTRRQDGRAKLRGSSRWLGNKQGEYSFAQTNERSKQKVASCLNADGSTEMSTGSPVVVVARGRQQQQEQQQDVSAAVSLPSEPSVLGAASCPKPQGDPLTPRVTRSASVPLLGQAARDNQLDTTNVSADTHGTYKVATPGGVAGRMAMGAVTRASLKHKSTKNPVELRGTISGWGTTGSFNRSGTGVDCFGSPTNQQADPAVRWYGKGAKNTAIARNQARRDRARQ